MDRKVRERRRLNFLARECEVLSELQESRCHTHSAYSGVALVKSERSRNPTSACEEIFPNEAAEVDIITALFITTPGREPYCTIVLITGQPISSVISAASDTHALRSLLLAKCHGVSKIQCFNL